jgi:hypothetical protein
MKKATENISMHQIPESALTAHRKPPCMPAVRQALLCTLDLLLGTGGMWLGCSGPVHREGIENIHALRQGVETRT